MKKINLKGLTDALSDNEMKQVKGGEDIDKPVDGPSGPQPVGDPCDGKKFGDKCQLGITNPTSGKCGVTLDGKLKCVPTYD